jgi:hypothetical protein
MDYNERYNEANKVLAKYLDAFIEKSGGVIKETVEDIGVGIIRTSAYLSPLENIMGPTTLKLEYQRMIREEDLRMVNNIINLFANHDIIFKMTLEIVTFLFSNFDDKIKNNLIDRRYEIEDKITDTIAKQAVKAATKIALIEIIIKLIVTKIAKSPSVISTSRNLLSSLLTIFQIYSYFDKASLSARRLRKIDKALYDMLYSLKVEMLYFLIEEKIEPLIKVSRTNHNGNADELMNALFGVIN